MGDDPSPTEIATTPEWREDMVEARKRRGMGQEELGFRVTHKHNQQGAISQIETGGIRASALVLPICAELRIPPPMHYISASQRDWAKLGHRLEELDPAQFTAVTALIASMVERADAARTAAQQKAEGEAKARKPMRAIGSATVGSREVPLRAPDTLPFERPATKPTRKKPR